jgi:hypothetical protein
MRELRRSVHGVNDQPLTSEEFAKVKRLVWGNYHGEVGPSNCCSERVDSFNGNTLGISKLHHVRINESDVCPLTAQEVHYVGCW